ncbi:aminoglycoside phosphotransferase family protein [Brachybacterium sp. UMB0905]|uniref:aminoglycoside phosphotransferase family protein n=1 Tax=Brachybacterium sp. UMB0905 TaxID=2069310 RepID=UPI001E585739|nr:aminoglycoside phosphotransferase family protein [Brachybacterium sp. UMB0905]
MTGAWHGGRLTTDHERVVRRHLDAPRLVADMSWGLVDTVVLHVRDGNRQFVVKAAGPKNHHIGREITAHEHWTGPLVSAGLIGRMVAADRRANLLITTYLPGELVEGTAVEHDPETYRQAGEALRLLHRQHRTPDVDYEAQQQERSLRWLNGEHRIAPSIEARVREILASWQPSPRDVVPCHGDFQPRNWLMDEERLRVIDMGRFALRPAETDLARLTVRQWRERPTLATAFLAGYGDDPRQGTQWSIDLLREAVGTAVWAHQVGDERFEAEGHRLLAETLMRPDLDAR